MHIPDGFLSPQTCALCYATTAPFWYAAWRTLKSRFESTTAAYVGMAAAFVFLLQMINVPIPGGTSGHAVGTSIVAIALGPATAIVAASMALLLQALVFGDGGLLAYGANVLTMSVIQAWVAWVVWHMLGRNTAGIRMGAAAFVSGYLAVLTGALATGLLLGLQPLLHRDIAGIPLYFPLELNISLPAMLSSHLLVGIVEGGVTLGAIKALAAIPEFKIAEPEATRRNVGRWIATALVAMVLLVPAGVILPGLFNAGEPWGEWSPEETARVANQPQAPIGLARYSEIYNAPVPDYQFGRSATMAGQSFQYMGAALLGVVLVALISFPLYHMQQKRLRKLREQPWK